MQCEIKIECELNSQDQGKISDTCGIPETDEEEDEIIIDPEQIQIKADANELSRRIECFITRKREQANQANIQKFCAYRQEDSASHIKVRRVFNQWSHQNTQKPTAVTQTTACGQTSYPPALDERLSVTERILGVNKPVPRDVYERMKKIEDRLSFLESISPEYKDLWAIDECESVKSFDGDCDTKPSKKRTHSTADLDQKLDDTEDRYVKKAR
ncbi:hypothetical protein QAD02_004455 [Eretmocerus hayati]|uniref:Uncharacterized protein n=1 Tax=Eretmocerus hayati TaxID=131215 RepID=A0ACC2NPT3_9HYME|nr:hypothetical protein QAD02_004455 [Eretmocerus hayati]